MPIIVELGKPFNLYSDLKVNTSRGSNELNPMELKVRGGDGQVRFIRHPDFLEAFENCNIPTGELPISLYTDHEGEIQVAPATYPMTIELYLPCMSAAEIGLFQAQLLRGQEIFNGFPEYDDLELKRSGASPLWFATWGEEVRRSYFPVQRKLFQGSNRLQLLINNV